ncbi:MAG TPA: class I SAM-dependent methyltransferase [Chloroflexia bacterium]|nr:class I SAM-dependent methyltransferase [Chloroflexia bacterium]
MVVERANREVEAHEKLGHGLHEKTDRRLSDILAPAPGSVCLDVATASGSLALALASRVGPKGKVIGIDLAQRMLDFASRKVRAHKVKNIELKQMNAQKLEFDDDTFDVVACTLAIFYFPDIEGALQEMKRVLKPGGTLGIATADPHNAFMPLSKPYMERLHKTADALDVHPPEYSSLSEQTRRKDGLKKLIKQAGFTKVDVREESIPVHFTAPDDWWNFGRGSTWGDLVLDAMPAEHREKFKKEHLDEVKRFFSQDGVKTATPVIFALARKEK